MAMSYRLITIYTAEEVRSQGRPLLEAVVDYVKSLKLAARCVVTRAMAGCYETGEIASQSILTISYNMPLKIEIVLPAAESEAVLEALETLVTDGIVAVGDLDVRSYKTRQNLIPRQIKVRDIMTHDPQRVRPDTPLQDVVRLLLGVTFTSVPVVDRAGRPLGIITQGDLVYRAGLPLRLGLLAESEPGRKNSALAGLAGKQAEAVMTRPAVIITEDQRLTDAVDLMLRQDVKRLPVVDENGLLTGVLSRVDVFRTITREGPDWEAFRQRDVQVENLRYVSDIMRRDSQAVGPDTPVEEVIRIIDTDDIQRVAVVDPEGSFLGMISDRDLLAAFAGKGQGFWDYLSCRLSFKTSHECSRELRQTLREKTAGEVMKTDLVIVGESTRIEEAIRLMVDKRLKRLPVVDAEGRFRGMVSRESLLKLA
jgi:CBS domain-containing protein